MFIYLFVYSDLFTFFPLAAGLHPARINARQERLNYASRALASDLLDVHGCHVTSSS